MFEMRVVAGLCAPVCVCDVCGEIIDHASEGMVVFRNLEREGEQLPMLFVHKHVDGYHCIDTAEELLANDGHVEIAGAELRAFMANAAANLGLSAADLELSDWGALSD